MRRIASISRGCRCRIVRIEVGCGPVSRRRSGLAISASALARPTPYVFKNTECDELHFIQEGELDFVTAFGTLRAEPGDFVYVARSVGYRLQPVSRSTLRLIVEIPERLRLAPSQPFGTVDDQPESIGPLTDAFQDRADDMSATSTIPNGCEGASRRRSGISTMRRSVDLLTGWSRYPTDRAT